MEEIINVIGGGFAGVEAAQLGTIVRLYETRPGQQTPAHRTDNFYANVRIFFENHAK
ncbi:MAG: hypothetical protein ACJ72Z_03550 [Pyrinomonadaceae bacterium]